MWRTLEITSKNDGTFVTIFCRTKKNYKLSLIFFNSLRIFHKPGLCADLFKNKLIKTFTPHILNNLSLLFIENVTECEGRLNLLTSSLDLVWLPSFTTSICPPFRDVPKALLHFSLYINICLHMLMFQQQLWTGFTVLRKLLKPWFPWEQCRC